MTPPPASGRRMSMVSRRFLKIGGFFSRISESKIQFIFTVHNSLFQSMILELSSIMKKWNDAWTRTTKHLGIQYTYRKATLPFLICQIVFTMTYLQYCGWALTASVQFSFCVYLPKRAHLDFFVTSLQAISAVSDLIVFFLLYNSTFLY